MVEIICPHCNYLKDIPAEKIPSKTLWIRCPECEKNFQLPKSLNKQPQKFISIPTKNIGLSIILTVLFGPLGMLYSTISGGIIMLVISFIIAIFTLGLGLMIIWPICIIWGAVSTSSYNQKLLSSQSSTPGNFPQTR